jgi:hypothetical protein
MWRLGEDKIRIAFENEYGDRVHVQDMEHTDGSVYDEDERYHVRYTPSRSDVDTTVPNGRFEELDDALAYAVDVVMDDEIDHELDWL